MNILHTFDPEWEVKLGAICSKIERWKSKHKSGICLRSSLAGGEGILILFNRRSDNERNDRDYLFRHRLTELEETRFRITLSQFQTAEECAAHYGRYLREEAVNLLEDYVFRHRQTAAEKSGNKIKPASVFARRATGRRPQIIALPREIEQLCIVETNPNTSRAEDIYDRFCKQRDALKTDIAKAMASLDPYRGVVFLTTPPRQCPI